MKILSKSTQKQGNPRKSKEIGCLSGLISRNQLVSGVISSVHPGNPSKSTQNHENPFKNKEIQGNPRKSGVLGGHIRHLSGPISISRPRKASKTIKIQENRLFWPSFLTSALYFQSIIRILRGSSGLQQLHLAGYFIIHSTRYVYQG